MRCLLKSALVLVVACGAGVALAGPLDRNAGSKVNGDMIGQPAASANSNYAGTSANRSFSYAPAPAPAAAGPSEAQTVPAPPAQMAAPQTAVRRYSYQPMQPVYRAGQVAQPSYLRIDRKVLGTYGE